MFLHVQSTQTLRVDNPYFFQMSFFPTKCAPLLLKIRKDFNIDDYKGKKTWTNENCVYNQFEHILFHGQSFIWCIELPSDAIKDCVVMHDFICLGKVNISHDCCNHMQQWSLWEILYYVTIQFVTTWDYLSFATIFYKFYN
jgi:hypothetical protein